MTMKATVTRDASTERPPGEPRFKVTAAPMRLRTGIDPSSLARDLEISREVATFKALTVRLERSGRSDHPGSAEPEFTPT